MITWLLLRLGLPLDRCRRGHYMWTTTGYSRCRKHFPPTTDPRY